MDKEELEKSTKEGIDPLEYAASKAIIRSQENLKSSAINGIIQLISPKLKSSILRGSTRYWPR